MEVRFLFILLLSCVFVFAGQDTGYPAGFMSDCPGMNRSTTFSQETRRSLSVVVIKPALGSMFGSSERKCQLGIDGVPCVAKFLDFRKRKTQVIISGYMDASFSPLVRMLVAQYVKYGRNVIVVEIFPLLVRSYPLAARVTRPLGDQLGQFLAELTRHGLSAKKLGLVGGSLGAHIASFASVKFRELTGWRPARLTGLDPAGPCFRNLPPSERFNRDAATKTDALHTNIDGFGIADAVAHVDFYANGGEYQPSMVGNFILPCFLLCSHVRAAYYWALAYQNPDKFLAVRCSDVASARHGNCYNNQVQSNFLGPRTNFSQPGIYYLPTNELSPYYIGKNGLRRRDYGVNDYLLKTAPNDDIVV